MGTFIVKEATFAGTYANPYKRGGRGMKWNKWKTVSKHQSLAEALAHAVVIVGLSKRAVFYKGEKLSDGQQILSGLSISREVERLAVIERESATKD
jgi:hypothetical protein